MYLKENRTGKWFTHRWAVFRILLGALMSLWISLNFSEGQIHDWAWRIPFIVGGIFGLVALYLRTYLKETPVFKAMQARKEISKEMPVNKS